MARNNIWQNVWEKNNGFHYAQRGDYGVITSNHNIDYNGYGDSHFYRPPGHRGVFQQEQINFGKNQGQYFGFSSIVAFSCHGGYPSSYYHHSQNSRDYRNNFPNAKRTRWDHPENGKQIALKNHPYGRRVQCYNCGRWFPDHITLHKHKAEQHKRSFYCSICNKEYFSHALMKKHESTHTINACQKCPETFKYKESLVAHVKHAHPIRVPAILPAISKDSGTEADHGFVHQPSSSAIEADSNDKIEKNDKFFSNPVAASTPIAEKKNQSETSNNSDSGVKTEQFRCPYCIKSFESEKKMYSHCKIHTEADPNANGSSQAEDKSENNKSLATLSCPLCIKKFVSRRDLFVHMSSIHTQVFYCFKCPAEFPSQNELTAHQREHE